MWQNNSRMFAILIAGLVLAGSPAQAQDFGNALRGAQTATETCAVCHGVRAGEPSKNPQAPSFSTIANTEGMSGTALNVALQTPHREMPNLMLPPRERADVIAYILTLKVN
jgi:mono/diheme cytochrome c family protein